MSGVPESVRMVCPNDKCLNKSIVYRKLKDNKVQVCKKCRTELVKAGN